MSVLQLVSAWVLFVLILYGSNWVMLTIHNREQESRCSACGYASRPVGENGFCSVCNEQYTQWFGGE